MKTIQYIPRATEKAYVAQTKNQYIFFVPRTASKQAIMKDISEAFKVTVVDVRISNRKGKATRFSRGKHAFPGTTYRQDHKVAYITVKEGDKIPVFETETNNEAQPEDKTDKKAIKGEKAEKKTAKKVAKKEEKESK